MKNTRAFLAVLVCGTMIVGCKKKDEKQTPAPETEAVPAEAAKTVEPMPAEVPADKAEMPSAEEEAPFAALIQHKVADFAKWKAGFDAHMDERKAAGIMGHHISRSADDENLVIVYLPMPDTESFTEMLASEDMKKAMAEAGVQGKPTVTILKPVETKAIIDRELAGAIIMSEVADFAAWKTVFDEHAAVRAEAGIIGYAINQTVDNPNKVVVLMQAETAEELSAFMESETLKAAMAKSGIKGEPKIVIVNSTAAAMY